MLDLDETMIARLLKGWDGIENAGEKAALARAEDVREQRDRYLADAKCLAAAFGTADGQAALAILVRMTLARDASDEERGAATCEQYALAKARREGQANVVFVIFEMLRVASGAQPLSGDEA